MSTGETIFILASYIGTMACSIWLGWELAKIQESRRIAEARHRAFASHYKLMQTMKAQMDKKGSEPNAL